jgi:hypothetical protein
MAAKSFNELYADFQKIAVNGTEEETRQFLIDHLNEFPEDVRDQIIFAFFEEGLQNTVEAQDLIADFQQAGLETVQVLEKIKRMLEDKKRELELKESLKTE